MKNFTTLAITAAFVVVSQTAIVPDAQAFSFGSFNFSDSWGDSWGDGWGDNWGSGYRRYDPRWDRYPPPDYRWNNAPPWQRGFSGQGFNYPQREGFSWGNQNGPRWGALPPPRWNAPPHWRNAPGYYPPTNPSSTPVPVEPAPK